MTISDNLLEMGGLINNQPLLEDRELVDMFIREYVENGIRSGEIQVTASSSTQKKSYNGKKESSIVYGQKGRNKSDFNQSVEAVWISNPSPVQQQQQGN